MDPLLILAAISGLKSLITLVQGLVDMAKQKGELTPEAEAEWKRLLDEYRATPAGTPTNAGKL